MRIAATVAAVLAVALVGVGVLAAEPQPEAALDPQDAEPVAATGNWTVVEFVSHSFRLTSTEPHAFDVEVPENATVVRLDVTPRGGVYAGPVAWTGLSDCDGETGGSVPTVDAGEGNNAASATCVLPAGAHTVTFSLPQGTVELAVRMVAVVPA